MTLDHWLVPVSPTLASSLLTLTHLASKAPERVPLRLREVLPVSVAVQQQLMVTRHVAFWGRRLSGLQQQHLPTWHF